MGSSQGVWITIPPKLGISGGWRIFDSSYHRGALPRNPSRSGKDEVLGVSQSSYKRIVNRNREVQRDHPLAGDMGVSPIFFLISPKFGGLQGVR